MVIFLCIACVGLVILLISAIFGGDHDFEHEVSFEHEVEHGGEHDSGNGPSALSIRVICMFLVGIGGGGALSRYYGLSYAASSFIGAGSGVMLGLICWQIMRILWTQQAPYSLSNRDFVDSTGVVNTAIPSNGIGEVSVNVEERRLHLSARSNDGTPIEEGTSIRVISCDGSTAIVEKAK